MNPPRARCVDCGRDCWRGICISCTSFINKDLFNEAVWKELFTPRNISMNTEAQRQIFNEIQAERLYQDNKWGTEFDDKNTLNDWIVYINNYAAKAAFMGNTPEEQRAALIKVASLAVAALETFDRNNGFPKRHYD